MQTQTIARPEAHAAETALAAAMAAPTIAAPEANGWEGAFAAYVAANEAYDAASAAAEGDDDPDEIERRELRVDALEALINTRAPSPAAMAAKARLLIEEAHIFYRDDRADCPAFLSHLLAGPWDECGVVALYQDALALAGVTGPLVDARPCAFEGIDWLAKTEAETGESMTGTADDLTFPEGGRAAAMFAALPIRDQRDVEAAAVARARPRPDAGDGWHNPTTPPAMLEVYSLMLANGSGKGTIEGYEAARLAVRQFAGQPDAPEAFDASAFLNEAAEAGLRVTLDNGRAQIQHPARFVMSPEAEAAIATFYSLSADQRGDLAEAFAVSFDGKWVFTPEARGTGPVVASKTEGG